MLLLNAMRAIVSLLLIFLSLSASGQELRMRSVTKVRPEDNGTYMLTGTVPGSRFLLVTAEGYKGLSLLDAKRGKIRKISSDAGAGYEPAITEDGKSVIYRSDVFSEQKKYTSLYKYDLVTGETVTLLDKERGVLPAAVSGNRILIKSDNKSRVETQVLSYLRAPETIFLLSSRILSLSFMPEVKGSHSGPTEKVIISGFHCRLTDPKSFTAFRDAIPLFVIQKAAYCTMRVKSMPRSGLMII